MNYKITGFIALLVLLGAAACQKKDNTVATPASVNISISSPVAGQVFHKGDTVKLVASVTYNTELHGYAFSIVDTATKTVAASNSSHVHDDHFDISAPWMDTFSKATVLAVTVQAALDHEGDEVNKTIYIQTQP